MILSLMRARQDFLLDRGFSFSSPSASCVSCTPLVNRPLGAHLLGLELCVLVLCSFDPWVILSPHLVLETLPALFGVLSAVIRLS